LGEGRVRAVNKVRSFKTDTVSLAQLREWLVGEGVTVVLMEATSSYWLPLRNALEDGPWELIVVNPARVKLAPGRKTDVIDCKVLAKLAALGMTRGSLVAGPAARDLKTLTRQRADLVARRTAVSNSLEKALERTGLKLSAVVSKLLGKASREILDAICRGVSDPEELAGLRGALKADQETLTRALTGQVTDIDRRVVRDKLAEVDRLDAGVAVLDTDIEIMANTGWPDEMRLLRQVPGWGPILAAVFIAETGGDMSVFPSGKHLASWAGVAPGTNSSAGKSKSSRVTKGNKHLKAALTLAAGNAARKKGTFFQARYLRILRSHGKKQARVAVARTMAVTLWAMLGDGTDYVEKGSGWYTAQATDGQKRRAKVRAVAALRDLGWDVALTPLPATA
ncbi:MAG: IS110 family transposase, partial [Bifidobacteriaceae bacterium]|nr:IS110 family transposase [Bifidobacteriaceae bacterium]